MQQVRYPSLLDDTSVTLSRYSCKCVNGAQAVRITHLAAMVSRIVGLVKLSRANRAYQSFARDNRKKQKKGRRAPPQENQYGVITSPGSSMRLSLTMTKRVKTAGSSAQRTSCCPVSTRT